MVDTIDRSLGSAAVLPFGMKPAPQRAPKTIGPVDLGDTDASYRGWMVVYDGDMDWAAFVDLQMRVAEIQERINAVNAGNVQGAEGEGDGDADATADAASAGADGDANGEGAEGDTDLTADLKAMMAVMAEMTTLMCYAWNFVNNLTGALLPQPRDGGAALLPMTLYGIIAQAYSAAQRAPKRSRKRSTRR